MEITTLDDYALVATCCDCSLPSCGEPRKDCQSIEATLDASDVEIPEGDIEEDGSIGLWTPFAEPAGSPGDDIPTLYRQIVYNYEDITGTSGYYETIEWIPHGSGPDADSSYFKYYSDYTNDYYTLDSGYWNEDPPLEGTDSQTYSKGAPNGWTIPMGETIDWVQTDPDACTATEQPTEKYTFSYGTEPNFGQGPWGNTDGWWVIDAIKVVKNKLSAGITKPELIQATIDSLSATWPDPPTGTYCSASTSTTWPKISSFYSGDPPAWPDCEDALMEANASATVRKARYRMAPPAGFGTETPPRSYYEAQWDEYFFPLQGDPSLIASRSWLWNGDAENPWSDWYVINAPETEGETRIVNIMVRCWKSSRIGNKPNAFGEVYNPPEA